MGSPKLISTYKVLFKNFNACGGQRLRSSLRSENPPGRWVFLGSGLSRYEKKSKEEAHWALGTRRELGARQNSRQLE